MIERDNYITARRYLAPPRGTFWQWQDEGQVLCWADGSTIAFGSELEHVVRRLAPQGLPPMGALVLLLAACRESWPESSAALGTVAGTLASLARSSLPDWLPEVLSGLDAVNQLNLDVRGTPEGKADLAELVFEAVNPQPSRAMDSDPLTATIALQPSPWISPADAQDILKLLADSPPPALFLPRDPASLALKEMQCEFRALRAGLTRVDPRVLELRRRTGLDRLVRPAELELPPPERARRLISQLEQDEELGGLARIARNLLAAVNLPHTLVDHEELPLGGVSDITNRGPLDRLLLSELAQDDLSLAVRVAVGEALYLRREAPPRTPLGQRALLLDAGIRLWGVPRVFAAAVALALAASTDKHRPLAAFRAGGGELAPVDLTTRDGLLSLMEALTSDLHPGEALPSFAARLAEDQAAAEAVIVTSDEALADADFQQALTTASLPSLYVATVNRQGEFRLSARSLRGSKPIREAKLNLDDLLEPPQRPSLPLIDHRHDPNLPAILSIRPFPLRLSHVVEPQRLWPVGEHGVLAVTRDRRLMHWDRRGLGARQLADDLPRGGLLWRKTASRRYHHAVIGNLQDRRLFWLTVEVPHGNCEVIPLEIEGPTPQAACGHCGVLFLISKQLVQVIDVTRGRQITSLERPAPLRWQRDRYFRGPGGSKIWYALSFDGLAAQFELVPNSQNVDCVTLIDRLGHDGPIGITAAGNLYDFTEGREKQVPHPLSSPVRVSAVSHDGRQVVLEADNLPGRWLVNTVTGGTRPARGDPAWSVERTLANFVQPQNLMHRFTSIHAGPGDALTLFSFHGRQAWRLEFDAQGQQFLLRAVSLETSPVRIRFAPGPGPPNVGFRLSSAAWPDGSRAVLDSRGLLHLKSSDRQVPELTFVLHPGATAGWCADGRVFGRSFFVDEDAGRSSGTGVSPVEHRRDAGATGLTGRSDADVLQTAFLPFVRRLP
jgi:hypothetical protein